MSNIINRKRYVSVSQRQLVQDNRQTLISAILNPAEFKRLYDSFYPDHEERLRHNAKQRNKTKSILTDNVLSGFIERALKYQLFVNCWTKEVFKSHLQQLPEEMSTSRRNVCSIVVVVDDRNNRQSEGDGWILSEVATEFHWKNR